MPINARTSRTQRGFNASAGVEITGLVELIDTIDDARALTGQQEIRKANKKVASLLHGRAYTYPAPRPNQKYVRTYKLKFSWERKTPHKRSYMAGVESNTPDYNKWVMAEQTQASIHEGRWWTVEQIADDNADRIVEIYEKAAQEVLDRNRA